MIKLLKGRHDDATRRLRRGIPLARDKQALNNPHVKDETPVPIRTLDVPDELVVPLIDYHQRRLHTHLRAGDEISCGDVIAGTLIAPASGTISSIEPRPVATPYQTHTNSVVIKVDHTRDSIDSAQTRHTSLTRVTLERVQTMGLSGLGGAGFPTHEKLNALNAKKIKTVIINGAECEPVIACDEALMQCRKHARDIVRGIGLLIELTQCQQCVLVIENDKSKAIAVMRQAIDEYDSQHTKRSADQLSDDPSNVGTECPISLLTVVPIYPSGAERPLVELVTGQRLAPLQKSVDLGVLCINVATAESVAHAADGFPLISRVITVAGNQAHHCINVRARLGTSVLDILRQTGNLEASLKNRVRIGGPLSGFDLDERQVAVTTKTNCITVDAPTALAEALPCIRCGACEDVCPVHLAPQQLYWFGQAEQQDYLDLHQLDNCIECACCDLVCPSQIPLTDTFRQLRASRQQNRNEALRAEEAEDRYQAHIKREETRAQLKESKRLEAQARIKAGAINTDDVLARIKRKRNPASTRSNTDNNGDSTT